MNKDLIKIENAAIRAAGSRMSKMFRPIIPIGQWEQEGDKEARRAFYEGFQEGAAYYRLLISRIDDEFNNHIEGARLDIVSDGQLTEREPERPNKDDSTVAETREACIKATPEQCQACDSNADCPRSCSNIEKISEQVKAEPEKKAEKPNAEETQLDPEDIPLWKRPMDKIEKVLQNLSVKFDREGDGNILYLRFTRVFAAYTIYFQKQENGNYNVVFSDSNADGGKVVWAGVVNSYLRLMELERTITEYVSAW